MPTQQPNRLVGGSAGESILDYEQEPDDYMIDSESDVASDLDHTSRPNGAPPPSPGLSNGKTNGGHPSPPGVSSADLVPSPPPPAGSTAAGQKNGAPINFNPDSHSGPLTIPGDLRADRESPRADLDEIERQLVVNSARSHRFFMKVVDRVAPYNPATEMFRKDFSEQHFQCLWEIIAKARLTTYSSLPEDKDCALRIEDIEAGLTKAGLSKVDADRLVDEMKYELENTEHRPELTNAFLNSTGLRRWLNKALVKNAFKKITIEIDQGKATSESFRIAGEEIDTAIGADDSKKIVVRSIMDVKRFVPEDEVFGPGFFATRGQVFTLIGPSGQGKSSLAIQLAISFALGKPCFGFVPRMALRVLIVQDENCDGDMALMRDGIIAGLKLTENEKATVAGHVVTPQENVNLIGDNLVRELKRALTKCSADLVVIDPALAYLGGDAKEQKDVSHFLRQGIWPLAKKFRCLVLIVHHTNKISAKDRITDLGAYAASGSAEWDNVPRGVITLGPIKKGIFALTVPKRYQRLGWGTNPDGSPVNRRYLRQCREPGKIFWEECTPEDVRIANETSQSANRQTRSPGAEEDLVLAVIEETGSINQDDLFQKLKGRHAIGKNRARDIAKNLQAEGDITRTVRDKAVWYEICKTSGQESS